MSRPVLVDSSWYITYFRQSKDPLPALAFIAETRDVATCGIVKAEVGRGLKSPEKLARYERAWEVMLCVDSVYDRWEETLKLVWQLDRKGVILPVQDVHIAACAIHLGAVILTYDKHFKKIPGLDSTDVIY
ncbi:PIN domain-containing protein [Verrucomicrobiales bacterium]|jgi:predicted nucleic acid-binding protein|nr:PIN domain-containing protein [Verrucomicrobiales bacterium]|tara:strand:+ start:529 stop:921 length:393 start_codon:yes stop_codon:yes gene_type:complete